MMKIVALAILAGLTCGSALPRQVEPKQDEKPQVVRGVSMEYLTQLAGITVCHNGNVAVFIREGLDEDQNFFVRAHEQKHVEQYARFSSCEVMDSIYRTPKGIMQMEVEAYHAGLCAAVTRGLDENETRAQFIKMVYHTLGGGTHPYTIAMEFAKYGPCPPDGGSAH
jgi:hypothetical protein